MCTSQLLSPAPRKNRFTTNSCHVTVYVISRRSLHQPRRECERSIVIVHYLATGSVLLPKVFDLFLISADKWKMPEAIPQNDAIDGVSLHWFPKDLNLRKILTSKVKIKRGNWTGSSDSSGTLLLRTPKPPGRASAVKLAQWHRMIALRDWNARECEWPDRMKLPF